MSTPPPSGCGPHRDRDTTTETTTRWELPDDCGEMPEDYVNIVVEELQRRGVSVLQSHESGVQLDVPGWLDEAEGEECWAGWGIDPTDLAIVLVSDQTPNPSVYAWAAADRTDPRAVAAAIAGALPEAGTP